MPSNISSFFDAIPAAAESELGLIAFALALVAATVLWIRFLRMRALRLLPAKDRARVLARETDHAEPRDGLSGEQWLRHLRNRYIFYTVAMALIALVVVALKAMELTAQQRPIPPGPAVYTVMVFSKPDGADVTINGKLLGETPYETKLPAGKYTISLTKDGYRKRTRIVDITPTENLFSELLEPQ